MDVSLVRVATKEEDRVPVSNFTIAIERVPTYPSTWFNNHKGEKPSISYIKDTTASIKDLYATIMEGVLLDKLDVNVAMLYVIMLLEGHKNALEEDWKSFEVTIGNKSEQITLGNVVTLKAIESTDTLSIVKGSTKLSPQEEIAGLILITGAFRVSSLSRPEHQEQVTKSIQTLLSGYITLQHGCEIFLRSQNSWITNRNFVKLMAAVDMYLNEFPNSSFAPARIGTIITRFRDCAVLVSLQSTINLLGLTFTELAQWIWTSKCADQFLRVIRKGEEMDQMRSYSMYFMDLQLSDKSPYSASINPDLHFYLHAIGTSMNIPRSCNARMVGQPEINDVLGNSVIVSYVLARYRSFGVQFSPSGDPTKLGDTLDLSPTDIELDRLPNTRDPMIWIGFMKERQNKIPLAIWMQVSSHWTKNNNLRDNTIGEYLEKLAGTHEDETE